VAQACPQVPGALKVRRGQGTRRLTPLLTAALVLRAMASVWLPPGEREPARKPAPAHEQARGPRGGWTGLQSERG
jgi:hypothetical protein